MPSWLQIELACSNFKHLLHVIRIIIDSFKQITFLFLLILSLSFGTSAQAVDATSASELPLLEPSLHVGTTLYGSGRISQDTASQDFLFDAAAQGMNAFTFYEDWSELEPEPGDYQLGDLKDTLLRLDELGFTPLLNITLIDIDNLNLPAYLLSPDGAGLAEDSFDAPHLVQRFTALLDEVVPLLVEHGGFLLLVGNEVDTYFTDVNPIALEGYTHLVEAAREHVQNIEPQLAVGVTLTGDEVASQGATFAALRPVTDIIPFNFYPLSAEFTVLPLEDIPAVLDAYIQVYGDAPIIIQELGCPSGSSLESSLDYQRQCFEVMFETLRAYPQVRYITVFTLYDWDDQTCDAVMGFLGFSDEELPEIYMDRIRDYLCTLGLLDADFSPKPAWDVFLGYWKNRSKNSR